VQTLVVAALCIGAGQHPNGTGAPRTQASSANAAVADFRFMVKAITDGHGNPYHTLSEAQLRELASEIEGRLGDLDRVGVLTEFARLAASIGDGHTRAPWPWEPNRLGLRTLPVRVEPFRDQYYVVGALDAHRGLIGARITSVGTMSIDQAVGRLRPIISRDNEHGVPRLAKVLLTLPEVLVARGIVPSAHRVEFAGVGLDGRRVTATVESLAPGEAQPLIELHDHLKVPQPSQVTRKEPYSWRRSSDGALLAHVNQTANAAAPPTLPEFCEQVIVEARKPEVHRIVFDLRYNTGGSRELLSPCVSGLTDIHRTPTRKDILVLIGRDTFSAGLWAALDIQAKAGGILVGEPTSGRPNFYGETRSGTTPGLQLRFTYSSRFNQRLVSAGQAETLEPQILLREGFEDYASGRDVVLERAMKLPVAR
jgi:hypothetical protein